MILSNFDSVAPNEDVINPQAEYEKSFKKIKTSLVHLQVTAQFTFLQQLEFNCCRQTDDFCLGLSVICLSVCLSVSNILKT